MTREGVEHVGYKIVTTYVNEKLGNKKDALVLDIGAGTGLVGHEVSALISIIVIDTSNGL